MIQRRVGDCDVCILPIVKGLVSESKKINEAYGGYEAYAIALGLEEIEALAHRTEIDDTEIGELDLVYAHKLNDFGEVEIPTPAYCELVDICKSEGMNVIPLDMNDEEYTDVYIKTVSTMEFLKEHRMAKKGMKRRFDMSSPESFAMDWDAYVGSIKGFSELNAIRERHIAYRIKEVSKFRRSLLAVVEVERMDGIIKGLEFP